MDVCQCIVFLVLREAVYYGTYNSFSLALRQHNPLHEILQIYFNNVPPWPGIRSFPSAFGVIGVIGTAGADACLSMLFFGETYLLSWTTQKVQ